MGGDWRVRKRKGRALVIQLRISKYQIQIQIESIRCDSDDEFLVFDTW